MKTNKGFIVPLLLGVIALLVIGGGIYIYQNKKAETSIDNTVPQLLTNPPEANGDSLIDVSDWKTYTDTEHGLELKYPNNYNLVKTRTGISIDSSTNCKTIHEESDSKWPKDCIAYTLIIQKNKISAQTIPTETKIAGYLSEKFEINDGMWESLNQTYFQFEKGDDWYITYSSFNSENKVVAENLLNQILSTFKFVNKTEPNILSVSITPSKNEDGWITFQPGAQVVVVGKNLEKVELRDFPTGTGIGEGHPDGYSVGWMTKISTNGDTQTWIYKPNSTQGIMSTNFWAVGYTADGAKIKSQDLGNVVGGEL